jgi:hypothetical protein
VTPTGRLAAGKTRWSYLLSLVGERLTGKPGETYVTAAMQRGTDLEPRARVWYSLETGRQVDEVGLVESDCRRWACSPDGLVGDDRGVEIKCLGRVAMLDALEAGAPCWEHMSQCQACLWITGRRVWDYVLWSDEPGMPAVVWPIEADAGMHAAFAAALPAFCAELDAVEARMRELPVPIAVEPPDPTADWADEA